MGKRAFGTAVAGAVTTLTVSAGAVSPDADKVNQFNIDTNAAFTINNPTNGVDAQILVFRIKNTHATTTFTVSYGTAFRFGSGVALADVNSIIAQKKWYVSCRYDAADSKWDVVGVSPGH